MLVNPADFLCSRNGPQFRLNSRLPGMALGLALPSLSSASPRRSAPHCVGSVGQSNLPAIPPQPVGWPFTSLQCGRCQLRSPWAHGGCGNELAPWTPGLGLAFGKKRATGFLLLAFPTEMHKTGAERGKNNFHPVRLFIKKIPQEIGCYLQITTGLLANSWGQSQGQLELQLSSH